MSQQGAFRWPPARPGSEPPVEQEVSSRSSVHAASTRREHPTPAWWRAIEQTWLARTDGPLVDAFNDAAWWPDDDAPACPRCAMTVGPGEVRETARVGVRCARCSTNRFPWQRMVRLSEHDAPVRDAVLRTKFSACHRLGHELGRSLGTRLVQACLDARIDPARPRLIVPVPTTTRRRLARGIDHAGAIARGVASVSDGRVVRVLTREHRGVQHRLGRSARRSNLARSIRVSRRGIRALERASADHALIVLVDDVCTTGATLRACARSIRRVRMAGVAPEIWCAVCTRAQDPVGSRSASGARRAVLNR